METSINLKTTGCLLNLAFDRHLVDVRYFECENPNYNEMENNIFFVKIRHNDGECAKKLISDELKECKIIYNSIKRKDKAVLKLKERVAVITDNLRFEITSICEQMNYKDSSKFSYNIDRLIAFNKNLQEFN